MSVTVAVTVGITGRVGLSVADGSDCPGRSDREGERNRPRRCQRSPDGNRRDGETVRLTVGTVVAAPTDSGVWTASISPAIATATGKNRTGIALPLMRHRHRIPKLAPPRISRRYAGQQTFCACASLNAALRKKDRQCSCPRFTDAWLFPGSVGSPGRTESQGGHQRQDVFATHAHANRRSHRRTRQNPSRKMTGLHELPKVVGSDMDLRGRCL